MASVATDVGAHCLFRMIPEARMFVWYPLCVAGHYRHRPHKPTTLKLERHPLPIRPYWIIAPHRGARHPIPEIYLKVMT